MTELIRDPQRLMPHRTPAILLDEVLDYGEHHARALVRVRSDSPWFDAGCDGVPAWVGIEYMAQTIAVWSGHLQLRVGQPVTVAFLLGTRSYRCSAPQFPAGVELVVAVDALVTEPNGLGAFECRIAGGGIEASARVNAFRPDDPHDFVNLAY
jgi:predicted hotdog family 3-hydroxylacyl-ACP dehydratase